MTKNYVIATAGHVDHGKSSLVKALTGTDPDRLPEEKARQITIDLGFAHLELPAPLSTLNSQLSTLSVAIVDVPGHEDFVRNMIAGVGSIDLALLVVAADDGWMPQTEEHLQILNYLGVERAVIALTKIDIGDAPKIEAQIREQLRQTAFATSPIIPISVRANSQSFPSTTLHRRPLTMQEGDAKTEMDGIEDLKQALATELSRIQPQRDIGKPRLFVDRAFTLHGIGTVVTGTLTDGTFRRGDTVMVQPRNSPARIRSMQSHGRDVDLAGPGTRTAINLPDLGAGDGIARGDVVTIAGLQASATLNVVLNRSRRLPRAAPLKSGATVYLHHGTARLSARVILLQNSALPVGESALAQLRLSSPILAFLGDRFVIRDASGQHTLAGGIVLDPDGEQKRSDEQSEWLNERAAAHDDVDLCVASEIARRGPVQLPTLLQKSRFSAEDVNAAVQQLHHQKKIFRNGNTVAEIQSWRMLRARALEIIDQEHTKHPERSGIDLSELRAKLRDQSADAFDALIVDLCSEDFVRAGSTIARRAHRSALPGMLEAVAAKIRARLSEKPFDPPSRHQLAPDGPTQQALRFLLEQGELVELGPDVILTQAAFAQMKEAITKFISAHGSATVSQLRQELDTSRRIIVPLLELLDRQGVTRRVGDQRTLANQSETAFGR